LSSTGLSIEILFHAYDRSIEFYLCRALSIVLWIA
jgi:hypothetical protein